MYDIALYGDSVFDNQRYVIEGSTVKDMLIMRLREIDQISLIAKDGATSYDLVQQLKDPFLETSHYFISIGGNDALKLRPGILENNSDEWDTLVVEDIFSSTEKFRKNLEMVSSYPHLSLIPEDVTFCTIYIDIPGLTKHEKMTINIFNSIIIDIATSYGFNVLDLRKLFTQTQDFSSSSPIEPSEHGGLKLATAITDIVYKTTNKSTKVSRIYSNEILLNYT